MAITELIGQINILGISSLIIWFILTIVLMVVLGVVTYFVVMKMKFNKSVQVLEDVAGSDDLEVVYRDKAMLVKVGKGGLEVLYLRKKKNYVGAYGKRMGKNNYLFAVGEDGYWYNVTLGSLNKGLQSVGMKPTRVNMRYQNESIQEILRDRYNKVSFWQKYGGVIAFSFLIIMLCIGAYIVLGKWLEGVNLLNTGVATSNAVVGELKSILGSLENLCSGAGIR